MVKFFIYLHLFCSLYLSSQNIAIEKAYKMGSSSSTVNLSVVTDNEDNVIVFGCFQDSLDVDFSDNSYMLYSALTTSNPIRGSKDVFVAKYNPNGELTWAKSLGNSYTESSVSFATDYLGNIYLLGKFYGTVDFDPSDNSFNLTSFFDDVFVLKLDSEGNFIWVKNVGGSNAQITPRSIFVDSSNVYFCGSFLQTCDFDPGPSTFNMIPIMGDAFVTKLNLDGNFVWAKQLSSPSYEYAYSISVGMNGQIYIAGTYGTGTDFDPGLDVVNLPLVAGGSDMYILKLNPDGSFNWVKGIHGSSTEIPLSMKFDGENNLIITGQHSGVTDFDPGPDVYNLANGNTSIFLLKLNEFGELIWVNNFTSPSNSNQGKAICIDSNNDIYVVGQMRGQVDFDSDPDFEYILNSTAYSDMFILKYSSNGMFNWATSTSVPPNFDLGSGFDSDYGLDIAINSKDQLFVTGFFEDTLVFNQDTLTSPAEISSTFLLKISQKGVAGGFYEDINANCNFDNFDLKMPAFKAILKPGDIVIQADSKGNFTLDSLPVGNYHLILDTLSNFRYNCGDTIFFTIDSSYIFQTIQKVPLQNIIQCSKPTVSIIAPIIRRCFSDQHIYVKSCNETGSYVIMNNAFTDVKLDELLQFTSSSISSTSIGNNSYRFLHGDLYPGNCIEFIINVQVSCDAVLGQTLCMEANLYPADSCVFDTIRSPNPPDFTPCSLPWDKSSLKIDVLCQNDSLIFTIINTGEFGNGDMDCFSPVRLFIDGDYMWLDSIKLEGGESKIFTFSGDGRTWRMEVDQHPLHPGNSKPNASIEACGEILNWTPNRITILPQDDAEVVKDIFCGVVTGSYDPNDKTGYPLGISSSHLIQPNGQLDYVIRFQNTGTDTAFTVVIRDTLDTDLNIFSVQAGVSSHNYSFRMYGPRVLEWTFNNILLPDSTTNEIESHGFVTFTVNQYPNLIDSTEITNNVGIYFDFNDPIITNTTSHKIGREIYSGNNNVSKSITLQNCQEVNYNSVRYTKTGLYFQVIDGGNNEDTLLTLSVRINNTSSIISETVCNTYTAPDSQVYTQSGIYTVIIPNAVDCDSTITINLTVNQSSSSTISETACSSYTAPDNQIYTQSGMYSAIISNAQGCDSSITIDLTIITPTSSSISESVCSSYTAPDNQVYTQSGTYTAIIPNIQGCDSTITIDLTIKNPSNSIISENVCDTYTAPDNQIYSSSGTYTAIIPNAQGCDSIITINLNVKNTTNILTETACQSYTAPDNQIYTQSGTYSAIIPNSVGCDSIITINLTVSNLSSVVIQQDSVLYSTIPNATYQWIDCLNGNQIIPNETNQSFVPQFNGEYAVIINKENCTDTSACFVMSNVGFESLSQFNLVIKPNPTTQFLSISIDKTFPDLSYKVLTISGQLIEENNISNSNNFEIDVRNYSNGMYFLTLDLDGKVENYKFIKE